MESDVEALLVNRLGYSCGYSAAEYYLLPIDECYKLVGLMVQYLIDSKNSTFTVRAFATGLLSAFAHNSTIAIRDFEGEISFNAETVEQSSMRLVIRSASLAVTDDVREKDRAEIDRAMHEEVLEVEVVS